MRRKRQQLPEQESIDILKGATSGTLALTGHDGYPYAVPISYVYSEGKLYFHSAMSGHKIDAIRSCDKVSYCVYDSGHTEGDWALHFRSVIVFGRAEIVNDHQKALEISRKLSYRFTSDDTYIENEIRTSGPRVLVFSIEIEHMCGKRVVEK